MKGKTNEKTPQKKQSKKRNETHDERDEHGQDANEKEGRQEKVLGRPSDYDAKASEFCKRIASGRTVRSVCRDEDMPTADTIYRWLSERKEFSEQYARAKEMHADALADEILEIADTADADNVCDEYGNIKPNHEWMNRSKLRVDARKWLLSKILPKKYGDKIEQTLVGDADKPIEHKHSIDFKTASNDEVMDFIRKKTHGE